MANNEKFNDLLNSCAHSREICDVLLMFAEPGVQEADNMSEKRQVIIGKLLSFLDKPESDQYAI